MSLPANPVFLYVVDTSFFIEIHKRYPKGTLPGIWKDLEILIRDGRIIAPENVKAEINRQDDELKGWANDHSEMPQRTAGSPVSNLWISCTSETANSF